MPLIDFTDPEVRRDPYPEYRRMRQTCPVAFDEARATWYVFRYADVRAVLADPATFSNQTAELVGAMMPAPLIHFDPPQQTRQRALINKAFTPRRMAELEPRVERIAARLLERVVDGGSGAIELVGDFAARLPVAVIGEMLGVPEEDHGRAKRWADAMAAMSNVVAGQQADVAAEIGDMVQYLHALAERRQREPGDDLLSALTQAEIDGDRLSMMDLVGFGALLFFGGTESTSNLLALAVAALLDHPDVRARVERQRELLPRVVEETLRYRAPSQAVYRIAARDVELQGQTIRRGQAVIPVLGSANHDEEHFVAPDRFDIDRPATPHTSFGNGIHFCLGAALTRIEGRVSLAAVLDRLPSLRRADTAPLEPLDSYFFTGFKRLPLRFG